MAGLKTNLSILEVMASYKLIYLAASDGKLETINKKKKKEANAPDPSLMIDTPNAKGVRDFYRLVEIGEAKEVEWVGFPALSTAHVHFDFIIQIRRESFLPTRSLALSRLSKN